MPYGLNTVRGDLRWAVIYLYYKYNRHIRENTGGFTPRNISPFHSSKTEGWYDFIVDKRRNGMQPPSTLLFTVRPNPKKLNGDPSVIYFVLFSSIRSRCRWKWVSPLIRILSEEPVPISTRSWTKHRLKSIFPIKIVSPARGRATKSPYPANWSTSKWPAVVSA